MTDKPPIQLVAETTDTVILRRADFEAIIDELEDLEDSCAVLQHDLDAARGNVQWLTRDELDAMVKDTSPVKLCGMKSSLTPDVLRPTSETLPSKK